MVLTSGSGGLKADKTLSCSEMCCKPDDGKSRIFSADWWTSAGRST